MAQPFNYNLASPMASFAQGLQIGNVLDVQRKAQDEQQRAQESEAALLAAFENELPTTEQISNLILKNPAIADRAKQAYAMRTAPQREADERQRTQLYMLMRAGDTEAVKAQMQTFADAARNSGREQEAAQAEANLRVYEQNQNAGMIAIGSMIAANNPELWNKLSQTEKLQAETGKIAAETSTEKTKAKFAEANAVMALKKQGWEIKALQNDMVIKRQNAQIAGLNAAIGREGNDLKRQELQLKIAELRDKVSTRVQERAAEGNSALAQADNLLSSANKAVKAAAIVDPKTGKITGYTSTVRSATGPIQSRLPTINQDVADFEALIDNLGSQTVMARINEMKGVLSDRDLEVLRTSMASLDLKQSPAALVSNLQKIQQLTNKAKKVTAERYGAPLSAPGNATPTGGGGGSRVVGRRAGSGEVPVEQLDYVPGVTKAADDTSVLGLVGAATRGLTAPMAGAAVGAAMGAPFAGVGAVPGAAAGLAAGALTEAFGDPIVRGINSLFGTNFTEPTTALQNLLTNLGVPEADSEAERIVQKVATGVAGGVSGVGMGKAISSMAGASRPVMQRVGAAMAEQPFAQIAGGAGAGLAAGLVSEDAGALAETGAAIVGGLAGGAAGAGLAARRVATSGGATGAAGASGGRASVAAAATPESALRLERAERLGVKMLPPQASRDFVSQQRMRELAKNNDVGGPIRERLDNQSDQLRQRFESFIDGTGSEQWNNKYAQGNVIADALGTLAKRERTRIKALYNRAERAGELREPVSYEPVVNFINQQTPTTREKLAPVLQVVEEQLKANDLANSGQISLKQMEDVRQLINKVAQPGTPDYAYGRDLKELIDLATQDAGGDVYKLARAARARYANEFENIALVDDLIGLKPGNVDRIVALERVVDHITRGQTSLDSVNSLKTLLDRAGPRGKRAMSELQGAVMENIRDAAYAGITRDQGGGVVISPAKLNNAINKLDTTGKLEAIFDGQTAQTLRDVNLLVQDIATAPPGTLNTSSTSSAIINAIDMLAMLPGIGGLAARGVGKARETAVRQELKKEVRRLIGDKEK